MMKIRTSALVMALALSVSMLSACGSKEPAKSPAESAPDASISAPAVSVPEEQPDASTPDVSATEEQPDASTPETPAEPAPEQPAEPEQPAQPAPEKPAEPAPEKPAEPAPEAPAEPAPEQSAPAAGAVDLNAFVVSLAEKYGEEFPANANVVEFGMHADLYPGIDGINTKQRVIYQPMMGAVVCEIALAEVADAADVEAVKAVFQSRIDAQVDGGAWYPASIEGWQNNSRIVTNGNFVMMIAWDYCDEAVSAFNGLF